MFRKAVIWLHKWLGIITGIIVFLVSLSGAVYCFQDELKLVVYTDRYMLPSSEQSMPTRPLSELLDVAKSQLADGQDVSRIDLYPARDRNWVFRAVGTDEQALGHWNYFRYYKRIFVNPYNAEVVGIEDSKNEFFQLVLQLHMNLLLGKTYGHAVVGYSTAIFVVLLLSGIVLWWPKNRKPKTLKRSFWFNARVKWKRLNYDLHNVLGFYSFFIALLLCVTGLVFSFPGFKKIYLGFFDRMTSEAQTETHPQLGERIPSIQPDALDNTVIFLLNKYPEAGMMSIRLRDAEEPLIDVQIRMEEGRSGNFKWYYVRRKTLQIEKIIQSEDLKGGAKMAALNYDLHTGNIGGFGTKLLACLIALFCASLPVTGYILWWHKAKKRRKTYKK
ncbi:PepSY-associated TM helix domain-containing protein [Sphingobacterium suaedae]|uniref:PepSY-associated TM helix domain-containing protein n=1 Tax=Sphingobacterium suaedae TaxID=1686402 RepID=A0ABW5KBT8_9SPHI